MTKGKRGGGSKHQLLWEEVPFLKVEKTGKPVAIYKREDVQKDLPLEQRNYYAHFPHLRDKTQADVPLGC